MFPLEHENIMLLIVGAIIKVIICFVLLITANYHHLPKNSFHINQQCQTLVLLAILQII